MLELKNICFGAEENGEKKEILKNVSLTIDERFVAITGPNGGGKSTLIKIIAGVLKPTSGQILLDGEDITDLSITDRANRGISYAFQQPVRFNGSLSGGELKRIEIATILARGTKLSLFDEPEAGIDLWSFGSLISVFENLYQKIKGNILIISHQERILNIADRIIVLAGGNVIADGDRESVLPGLMTGGGVCSKLTANEGGEC